MLEEKPYNHGEIIFREGEECDFAYLVAKGHVEIFKQTERGTVLLSKLGEGELFGEMGLINGSPRSASAAAEGPVILKKISVEAIEYLMSQSPPEVSQMMRSLMERLEQTNQKVSRLVSKQSQFQLETSQAKAVKRVSLLPLTSSMKELLGGGQVIQLPYRIGAAGPMSSTSLHMNDLFIENADTSILSPNHLVIQRSAQGIQVIDRGSVIGSLVNDQEIGKNADKDNIELHPGENTVVAGDRNSPYRFCVHWETD